MTVNLLTNDTWDFRMSLKDTTGALVDLNGYKLFFTIKRTPDDIETDGTNINKQDFTISTSVLYKDIQVAKEDTDIAE